MVGQAGDHKGQGKWQAVEEVVGAGQSEMVAGPNVAVQSEGHWASSIDLVQFSGSGSCWRRRRRRRS